MTEKSKEIKAAEWLVAAYLKSWTWKMFATTIHESIGMWPSEFSFLPDSRYWSGNAPVRSYVAQNWPRLNAVLDGDSSVERKLGLSEQIVKLKWNGNRPLGSLSTKERNEIAYTKKLLRQATTSYRESRKEFQAHSKTQWNVCK